MKPMTLKQSIFRAAGCAAFLATTLTMSSCGGGGGGGDNKAPYTRRPKTMDGIVLTLDNGAQFEFIRSTGTNGAQYNGDVETGAVEYMNTKGATLSPLYFSPASNQVHMAAPVYASGMSYTYTATNSEGGVLHLKGVGASWLFGLPAPYGGFQVEAMFYPFAGGFANPNSVTTPPGELDIAITFTSNNAVLSSNTVNVSVPEYSVVNRVDNDSRNRTAYMQSSISLKAGGFVPENYNPFIPLKRPSKIAPISFEGMGIAFTNGASNTAKDFSLRMTKVKTVAAPAGSGQAPTEYGSAVMFINGVEVLQNPGIQYSWQRIDGTDTGTLIITGGKDNVLEDKYTLNFVDRRTGTYQGTKLPSADYAGTMFATPGSTTPQVNVSF